MSTIETIDKLMMAKALQQCLSRFPEIETLKREQREELEALIAGRDVIAILPTGFGKSLIFQVFCEAKLSLNPNTCILVVAPLNSIVQDQVDELTELASSPLLFHLYCSVKYTARKKIPSTRWDLNPRPSVI